MNYFSLGNDVVNLIAIVNDSDVLQKFDPMKANIDGSIFVIGRYPFIDTPTEFYSPFVVDVDDIFEPISPGSYGLLTASVNYLFNEEEDTFYRKHSNEDKSLLTSVARSASINSSDITNYNSKGAHFSIDVSAIAVDATITPIIQGKDLESGNYYDILVGSTITATGMYIFKVYPGIGQIPNGAASDILPFTFRLSVTYGGTDTITYSASCSLIV